MYLRATVTAALPFIAADHCEMGTLSGKGPAVVQGPYHGNAGSFEIGKEQRQIEEPAVEVVAVYYIRLESPQPSQEQQSWEERKAAVEAGEFCQISVKQLWKETAGDKVIWSGVFPFGKACRGHYGMAFGLGQLRN